MKSQFFVRHRCEIDLHEIDLDIFRRSEEFDSCIHVKSDFLRL